MPPEFKIPKSASKTKSDEHRSFEKRVFGPITGYMIFI